MTAQRKPAAFIETAHHRIGLNRGKRRIWLEGKRVAASGFTPGTTFWQSTTPGQGTICLTLSQPLGDDWKARKVSGKGDKPIIDMVGAAVSDVFPDYVETVAVNYCVNVITIVPVV